MGTLDSELSSKENIDSATGFSNLLRAHEVAANFPVFLTGPFLFSLYRVLRRKRQAIITDVRESQKLWTLKVIKKYVGNSSIM